MLAPFILSSAFWGLRFAELLDQIHVFFIEPAEQLSFNYTYYITLFNAIILINLIISDAVVVWRACVLCQDDFKKLLLIPKFWLILTTLSNVATIGLRIASYCTPAGPNAGMASPLIRAIDVFQVSNLTTSFITNLTATSVVGLKVWRLRRTIKEGFKDAPNNTIRVERILTLLIESGFLYCIFGAIGILFSVVKIPHRTVGDIYSPMSLQVAGMYPTIVIVLINLQSWTEATMLPQPSIATTRTMHSHIQFARSVSQRPISIGEEAYMQPETSPTKADELRYAKDAAGSVEG
ncbi:hypothetical protein EIP86_003420 [Pleurotus ostreatoroseus]|nr:hypothetical protein EIP86_003420 [Pleurotus ostreatoroseus]